MASVGGPSSGFRRRICCPGASKPTASGDTNTPLTCDRSDIDKLVASVLSALPADGYECVSEPLIPRRWTYPTLEGSLPCLYVFPEGSGQAAIFAIPGCNMLVNAGCAYHPSFYPVANHLDRLDAVLLTHWGVDSLLGLSSVLSVAFARTDDAVLYSTLCLLTPPLNPSGFCKLPEANLTKSPLTVSIPREMAKLVNELKQQGTSIFSETLTRGTKMANAAQAVQLFQKVGQGSLELIPLTPTNDDPAELRIVAEDWAKASPGLIGASVPLGRSPPAKTFTVPLLLHISASTLVVWEPSKDTEAILCVLFVAPNAHQARVIISLEAIVASNIYLRQARAAPSDYERKRTTATAPGHARRSVLPGAPKPASMGSVGLAPTKSSTDRMSAFPEKKPAAGRTGVPQGRPSSKPKSTSETNDHTASRQPSVSGSAIKKPVNKTLSNVPPTTAAPAATETVSNDATSLAAETAAAEAAAAATSVENNHELLNMNAESISHELNPFDMSHPVRDAHTDELTDPIISWGEPQGLPVPPLLETTNFTERSNQCENGSDTTSRLY
ncbi:Microtubule-associated protein 1A [Fasciola gigantica]|uniref:Microtubule-associated protein 1A n=1 Tax=Fasciola gigantica TaxID=46835 RepID=A0A504YRG3_FASGI|nr:Microtubule-associated protein 1A [Fasciola gigantica]